MVGASRICCERVLGRQDGIQVFCRHVILKGKAKFVLDEPRYEKHGLLNVKCCIVGTRIRVLVLDVVTFLVKEFKIWLFGDNAIQFVLKDGVGLSDGDGFFWVFVY